MNQNELFEKSKCMVPGGVHSPVRSFKGLHTTPKFIKEAKGAKFWDTDGKEYIDFCMSFGPLILGHQNEEVSVKLKEQLDRGWSYGACEPYSLDLAEFLVSKLDFIDQIRFVNSGTEAVMTAVRLARGVTKKNKIIKFNGCYHGHLDSLLIKAGSGLAGTAEASSAGVPASIASDTLVLELGDLNAVKEVLENNKNDVALIAIEPLPANNGLLPQDLEFLKGLRSLCDEYGALLLFDEVISGFRVGLGGMAAKTGITPDIVTYGKIIGGGLPVGAVGAKKEVMEYLAPVGPVYQAGTLSANPLAMVGGLSTLTQLTEENYKLLENNTLKIVALFKKWFKEYNNGQFSHLNMVSESSLFWIHPGEAPKRACDIPANLADEFYTLFEILLEKGIYLAPNAYEVGFVSLAHNEAIISELEQKLFS
ncbi:MAG: aspartate aminotransferase family protein [Halobacteriovoraceae bacterium]|nr:aspartate aminotransferase family protein [Halobacteriovoraceae bacterium]|tara:strand:- start:90548 stop:91813 length:1266 start_codon:yes stop_codon:yes gene_type:complete